MSAERKKVEEKVKREKKALPLEEMTLAEVGVEIPHELAERGWLPTDRINARRRVHIDYERRHQFMICDALNLGYLDYALALIRTYKQKDKIGLDPNVVGMMKVNGGYKPTRTINKIMYLYKDNPSATLDLLVSELIQAGIFLSYVAAADYYKLNLPKWDFTSEFSPIPFSMPIDLVVDGNLWQQVFEFRNQIPLHFGYNPYPKQLCVNMQFLSEDPISDRPEVQKKEDYKKLVGQEIAYHRNLFNLICDYIPFGNRLKLEETTYQFNGVSNPLCKQKFCENLKEFLLKHYEDYRKEQRVLQKAEVERIEKEEAERQRHEMARLPSEVRSLKSMVVKQAGIIQQQSEMMKKLVEMNRQQGKQMAELRMMFQRFVTNGSGDAMTSLFSIPASEALDAHFEIEEPKFH